MPTALILLDVQNLYYTSRQAHGRNVDYNALWARATEGRRVSRAIAYAIDRGDEKQRQFQNILRAIGFEVKLKPFIRRADGSAKGDWDVGITLDAIDHAVDADVVVLISGDGDFAPLVDRLRERFGIEVEVFGVPAYTADALIRAADRFVPVEGALLMGCANR
ncbi:MULTISPECIES: LabA-like NYN domain-containing protein [Halomonas]|uniref:Nuclease n=1 Tax=Halomonas halophila TaxID=29573 RepID=A0ABQ0U761_9GAMM|nr:MULTISPECIES: NYN domain-containing protein [Halomonas]MDR5890613.1 NYN domain-containing protein [Halomonas salina]WJY06024.1 NYN domain-containing protein [Halomonas halophila]GEK74348.1 nuclease [Halomonas halophila]